MIDSIIIISAKYLFYPILIGILSTVCYVLIFDNLFKKILIPWYFLRKYKSTVIDGLWKGKTLFFKFDIIMKQAGDAVHGEIQASSFNIKDGKEEIYESNQYNFKGEIRDGFVRLIYKEKDRNSFGFGCFILQIAGGGKVLNGSVIFVNEGDDLYSVKTHEDIKLQRS